MRYKLGTILPQFRCPDCRRKPGKPHCDHCDQALSDKPTHYRAQITIRGERKRKMVTHQHLAKVWLDEMSMQKVAGPSQESKWPNITYAELVPYVLEWYLHGSPRTYAQSTLDNYEREYRQMLEWWGPREVWRTRRRDVFEWRSHMMNEGRSTSSIRHLLDKLSTAHEVAVELDFLEEIPCRVTRPRYIARTKRVPIPEDEFEQLVGEASRDFDKRSIAIILLAGECGLSRKELLLLRGEDVHLDVPGLRFGFVEVASRGEGDSPKWGRSRNVPIPTRRLHEALEALPRDDGPLFDVKSADKLTGILVPCWRAAMGDDEAPQLHRLRHRYATWIDRLRVVPLGTRQKWLGHRNSATTDGYTHPSEFDIPQGFYEAAEREADPGGPQDAHSERSR